MTMWVIPEDLGNFSPKKEKNLGEQKFARLSVSNFCGRVPDTLLCGLVIVIPTFPLGPKFSHVIILR